VDIAKNIFDLVAIGIETVMGKSRLSPPKAGIPDTRRCQSPVSARGSTFVGWKTGLSDLFSHRRCAILAAETAFRERMHRQCPQAPPPAPTWRSN
jgi:hypothetical protein